MDTSALVPMAAFSVSLAEKIGIKPIVVALQSRTGSGWPDTFSIWRYSAFGSGTVSREIFS
jgi:hypothetical protein